MDNSKNEKKALYFEVNGSSGLSRTWEEVRERWLLCCKMTGNQEKCFRFAK
jgi:hypothetical protein